MKSWLGEVIAEATLSLPDFKTAIRSFFAKFNAKNRLFQWQSETQTTYRMFTMLLYISYPLFCRCTLCACLRLLHCLQGPRIQCWHCESFWLAPRPTDCAGCLLPQWFWCPPRANQSWTHFGTVPLSSCAGGQGASWIRLHCCRCWRIFCCRLYFCTLFWRLFGNFSTPRQCHRQTQIFNSRSHGFSFYRSWCQWFLLIKKVRLWKCLGGPFEKLKVAYLKA